jgi:predicted dehydrogenase
VNEQATHLVDLCRYLAGEITDVQARISVDGETAAALFTFHSGALGTLLYTCGAPEKGIGLRLFTNQGALHLDGWDFHLTPDVGELVTAGRNEDPFTAEVVAFINAIESGDRSKIRCDLADAYETQRVMERLQKSAAVARQATLAGT